MASFSDYNPGFASPDSVYMQRNAPQMGNYTVTDPATGQVYPVAPPAPAPAPLPPMPATVTGFPQSAWSQALRTGMANGQGVRQIMAEYNPGMFGRMYSAPAPSLGPAEQLMANMNAPAPAPAPTGTSMGPSGSMPAPPMPKAQPGLQRMYGRFPGIATRMGYNPNPGMPAPAPGANRDNRRGR